MQLDPCDMERACLIAANLESRTVEDEGVEPRRADERGGPGYRRLDPRQGKSGTAVVIVHGDVAEKQLGPQALPVRIDGPDGDALAQRL